ncbi:helix-turn-helix domain-containing protein [Fusibacter ferrireducens]|uniref:Helix-turn-helix transcriptional regulator n=1 Tax=Fusibacter ferrireducens TaxID=2785058 RepID=A0ABR9ZQK6_9FIRM|nr:helix-turn-helix transcriptional regulator [Fusibacter ferrireducens]MBF4692266.1 helix-turn-helix transcriptional regulator [Fusibacter ferrireducens]
MSDYLIELGAILRNARKFRGLTIQQLADKIQKSKSTLSKYERGEIAIDILTINDISQALKISIDELLPSSNKFEIHDPSTIIVNAPSFFKGNTSFYSYYYDGRNKSIICSNILVKKNNESDSTHIQMYMNIKDLSFPQACENTYNGLMTHYDMITRIDLINCDTPIEKASIAILSPFAENDFRWGLWSGISTRPVMPASIKMLFTKLPQKIDSDLKKKLIITQEDYKQIKHYNMFTVF